MPQRSLAAVMFTDIVGSTERASELGDRAWRSLLAEHHAIVRREIKHYGGREVNTAGDGFLATFERPARAIRCAAAIREAVRDLGLEIRSGIHAGEIEGAGRDVSGIVLHTGARVAAEAAAGEVLVSSAVRDLVAGSGFRFEDRGAHSLKGLPGEWRLYAVKGLPARGEGRARSGFRLLELKSRRAIAAGAVVLVLALALAAYIGLRNWVGGLASTPVLAESAAPGLAVLPFTVNDPELDEWREGMVDLLSTNLDGAAGLRTIHPPTVLARWREEAASEGPPDLATSLEIGRRVGARYLLTGSVVAIGSGVRLAGEVLDAEDGSSLGRGQVEGSADSVFALVDRLSIEVLGAVLKSRGDDMDAAVGPEIDLARLTTASLPALKAYLEGEALFRRSEFEASIAAYERAVQADTTFALASYRLALAHGWAEALGAPRGAEASAQAARHAGRLPDREELLVRALHALTRGTLEGIGWLEEAVIRYPDDAEAWYLQGDTYFHLGGQAGIPADQYERSLTRAIELDPRFAPAYIHWVEAAFLLNPDSGSAAERIAAYQRIASGSQTARNARFGFALAFGDPATRATARAVLDTISGGPANPSMLNIGTSMLNHPRFFPIQTEVLAAAGRTARGGEAMFAGIFGMMNRLWRGQTKELVVATENPALPPLAGAYPLFVGHMYGLPVPPERLEESLTSPFPRGTIFLAGAFAAEGRRWDAVEAARSQLRVLAAEQVRAGDSTGSRYLEGLARALDGVEAWRRGEPKRALPILLTAQRETTGGADQIIPNVVIRWSIAEVLLEMDRSEEALPWFASIQPDPPARYREAVILEELGRFDEARRSYELFVVGWKDADPAVRPLVEEARQAAIRLGGLRRG